jgi:broad specificity phosphatase PhoE
MIYIIRHGQTAGNKAKVLQGRSNLPLNEDGIRQAEEVRDRLEAAGIHFSRVYTSPLTRAIQTGQILAGDAPQIVDDRLIEMEYGPYEGMSLDNLAPEVLTFFSDFVNNPAPAGMEPLPEIVSRLGEFLEDIREVAAQEDVLVSTHAIAMKGALEYLTPESHGGYWSTYIRNCAVYTAEVRADGTWTVPVEWVG